MQVESYVRWHINVQENVKVRKGKENIYEKDIK